MITRIESGAVAGIVFDAVGTLIDPRPSVAEVYTEAARRQGVTLDRGEVRVRFRRHFGRVEVDDLAGALVTDEAREYRRWRRVVGDVLPELPDPDRAFLELWDYFARPSSWYCFDDVVPALRALAGMGYRLGIASNFDGRLRDVARGLPGIAGWADDVVVSSEIGYRKPHPSFYQAACESLNLPADRVLYVGDDSENDYHGPRRAGLEAVLIDREDRGATPGISRVAGLEGLLELLPGVRSAAS